MDAAGAHLNPPLPAPAHADGPVDFFFIVCSPNVSPLTNALPEAQASAEMVESARSFIVFWEVRSEGDIDLLMARSSVKSSTPFVEGIEIGFQPGLTEAVISHYRVSLFCCTSSPAAE